MLWQCEDGSTLENHPEELLAEGEKMGLVSQATPRPKLILWLHVSLVLICMAVMQMVKKQQMGIELLFVLLFVKPAAP